MHVITFGKMTTLGLPLLQELRLAAERGVRVRLLVDDNGTSDLDGELAAPQSAREFRGKGLQPFQSARSRLASYFFDFFRLNRRMHNKSFTVDSAVTIIGGRNIGDIYFSFDAETHIRISIDVDGRRRAGRGCGL